ncbi:MAG: SAM-dependent methyltransferase [Lachnospiraceae bacterium]|nr:SAM-dependent methyltransferase [Lachnospiraceae bacterium]
MDELGKLLEEILNRDLQQIVLSNTRDAAQGTKVKVRPVLLAGELYFQETLHKGTQVFHENLKKDEMKERIAGYLDELFKQGSFTGADAGGQRMEATVLVSKKGKKTVKVRRQQEAFTQRDLSHNRTKQYILMDGTPVDFLIGLGVQTQDGKVTKTKYDKFRQINRYLEFIEDVLEALPKDRTLRIIDFGCGKSYLTFAMYYYLHELQGRDIQVTGLDLKEDVIRHCNELADKLHYTNLHFERGDISTYTGADRVDMVVSLHACDKATDFALEKAVKWNARVILAVPCCQHELNGQMRCETLQPVLKYGIIKERMAALLTDALRADLLEQQGYETQILEFIDIEHTPKNLLIRAVKRTDQTGAKNMKRRSENSDIRGVAEFLHVNPTLEQLLQ